MAKYKLTYFDSNGGRAEPVRIAFHAAGIEFEDHRISHPDFIANKSSFPLNAVPVLEIDDNVITQSNAMCRFIGKQAGLYPSDPTQALYCDEAMGTIEDMTNKIVSTFGLEGEALKTAREAYAKDWLPVFLKGLDHQLQRGGGEFFADNQLTVADLKVMVGTTWFSSGMLDHIPADIVEKVAPNIARHQERIASHPKVTAYYASIS